MPLGSRPWSLPEAGTFMGIDPRIAAQLRVNWRIGLLPPTETPVPSVGSSMNVGRQANQFTHGTWLSRFPFQDLPLGDR